MCSDIELVAVGRVAVVDGTSGEGPGPRWFRRATDRVPRDVMVFAGYQLALATIIVLAGASCGYSFTELSSVFRKNDASWFLSIAQHGYQPHGSRPSAIAFFPLYPALVRVAMFIFRKDVVAAFAVSAVASVVGHTWFYRALRSRPALRDGAQLSLLLFIVSPATIYFSLLYSESLFLLLTAGFLYFLLKDRVGVASVFAAFAALTRQPGFLCIVPLALWVLTDTAMPWTRRMRRLGWTAVAASGYVAFLAINRIVYHDWFAFTRELRRYWGKHPAPLTQTIPDAIRFIRHPDWYLGWPILADHYFVLAALLVLVLWPLLCRQRFERCRWVLLAWAGAQWLLIASSSAAAPLYAWMSSTRYLMLVLPLYVAVTDLVKNRRTIVFSLGAGSLVLAAASLDRWITKRWVA
ncbi:MAG: hypothetical protein JWM34_1098 [Ilumatobacteraceae bacterium]|nr:hypothetical protein [Ilumatobacteraceae bacterium]